MPKEGRGEATRAQILSEATRMFARAGYDDTSIDDVLRQCDISKGALYHHFRNKEALFAVVLETVEAHIVQTAANASREATNPLDALRAGCGAWLDLVVSDEAVRRIAVIDAPAVLGWRAWREMEGRYALGLLKTAFGIAADQDCFEPACVEPYAGALLAVLNEMAMYMARAHDQPSALSAARGAVEQVISRLIGVETGAAWSTRG